MLVLRSCDMPTTCCTGDYNTTPDCHLDVQTISTLMSSVHNDCASIILNRRIPLASFLTGDYNTTPDRHLGAAHMERLRPDLLISESTYATTLRDSKKSRERGFMVEVSVYACVCLCYNVNQVNQRGPPHSVTARSQGSVDLWWRCVCVFACFLVC